MNYSTRKSVIIALTAILLSCFTLVNAQKKIIVDAFADATFQRFDEPDEAISAISLNQGFELHVANALQVTVLVETSNGDFLRKEPIREPDRRNTVYAIKKEHVKEGFVNIKLLKEDGDSKIVRLKIGTDGEASISGIGQSNCNTPIIPTIGKIDDNPNCREKNMTNHFGEDISVYDKNTVVYVYDFNPEPSRRRFYKVTWKNQKGVAVLNTVPANLNNERLKAKSNAWFKVVNINKYLYDITIADSVVFYDSEPSSLFNQVFLGDSNLLRGLLSAFTRDVTEKQSALDADLKENYKAIARKIRCFLEKYNGLQARMLQAYHPCSAFPCCIDNVAADYHGVANQLLDIRIDISIFQNMLNELKANLKKKNEALAACKKIDSDLEANQKSRKPIEEIAEAKRTEEQKKTLAALLTQKAELEEKQCKKESTEELSTEIETLTKELDTYKAVADLLDKLPSEQDIRKLVVFLNNMVTTNHEEVFPLNTSGNLIDVRIHIKSNDSITKYFSIPAYNNPELHFGIPVTGRPFVSFSSGSFISFHERLKNKTYDWQQLADNNNTVQDSADYILSESGYTPPAMGFAAFGNFGCKVDRNLGLGLSIGVGLTIEKQPRAVYLAGGSLLLGNIRQFVITGGVAGMQVNRLKNNLQTVSDQGIIYRTKQTIEYFKEFKLGAFVAVSYTIFTIRKQR